jgi:hypothetical protein
MILHNNIQYIYVYNNFNSNNFEMILRLVKTTHKLKGLHHVHQHMRGTK